MRLSTTVTLAALLPKWLPPSQQKLPRELPCSLTTARFTAYSAASGFFANRHRRPPPLQTNRPHPAHPPTSILGSQPPGIPSVQLFRDELQPGLHPVVGMKRRLSASNPAHHHRELAIAARQMRRRPLGCRRLDVFGGFNMVSSSARVSTGNWCASRSSRAAMRASASSCGSSARERVQRKKSRRRGGFGGDCGWPIGIKGKVQLATASKSRGGRSLRGPGHAPRLSRTRPSQVLRKQFTFPRRRNE
jgi:hypothetical protein